MENNQQYKLSSFTSKHIFKLSLTGQISFQEDKPFYIRGKVKSRPPEFILISKRDRQSSQQLINHLKNVQKQWDWIERNYDTQQQQKHIRLFILTKSQFKTLLFNNALIETQMNVIQMPAEIRNHIMTKMQINNTKIILFLFSKLQYIQKLKVLQSNAKESFKNGQKIQLNAKRSFQNEQKIYQAQQIPHITVQQKKILFIQRIQINIPKKVNVFINFKEGIDFIKKVAAQSIRQILKNDKLSEIAIEISDNLLFFNCKPFNIQLNSYIGKDISLILQKQVTTFQLENHSLLQKAIIQMVRKTFANQVAVKFRKSMRSQNLIRSHFLFKKKYLTQTLQQILSFVKQMQRMIFLKFNVPDNLIQRVKQEIRNAQGYFQEKLTQKTIKNENQYSYCVEIFCKEFMKQELDRKIKRIVEGNKLMLYKVSISSTLMKLLKDNIFKRILRDQNIQVLQGSKQIADLCIRARQQSQKFNLTQQHFLSILRHPNNGQKRQIDNIYKWRINFFTQDNFIKNILEKNDLLLLDLQAFQRLKDYYNRNEQLFQNNQAISLINQLKFNRSVTLKKSKLKSKIIVLSQQITSDIFYSIVARAKSQRYVTLFLYSVLDCVQLFRFLIKQEINCDYIVKNTNNIELIRGINESLKQIQDKQTDCYYFQQNGRKIPYSESANQLFKTTRQNQFLITSKDVKVTTNETPTHIYCPKNQSLYHLRSKKKFKVIKQQDHQKKIKYVSLMANQQKIMLSQSQSKKFQVNQSFLKRFLIWARIEKEIEQIPINLFLYRVNKKNMTQTNLFTGFERKIGRFVYKKIKMLPVQQIQYKEINKLQVFNVELRSPVGVGFNKQFEIFVKVKELVMKHLYLKKLQIDAKTDKSELDNITNMQNVYKLKSSKQISLFSFDISKFKKAVEYCERYLQNRDLNIAQIRVVQYPKYWQTGKYGNFKLVYVSNLSQQFSEVQKQFKIAPIIKLQRIQNQYHYCRYYKELLFMQKLMGQGIQVKRLFHGTSGSHPSVIYEDKEQSFNINYARKGIMGQGIYFAKEASYSRNYSYQQGGMKIMMLCLVQVGVEQKLLGPCNQRIDTDIIPGKDLRYNSVFRNYDGSDINIVYKSRRAYPYYLIYF